jgi:hypothetical protein
MYRDLILDNIDMRLTYSYIVWYYVNANNDLVFTSDATVLSRVIQC